MQELWTATECLSPAYEGSTGEKQGSFFFYVTQGCHFFQMKASGSKLFGFPDKSCTNTTPLIKPVDSSHNAPLFFSPWSQEALLSSCMCLSLGFLLLLPSSGSRCPRLSLLMQQIPSRSQARASTDALPWTARLHQPLSRPGIITCSAGVWRSFC